MPERRWFRFNGIMAWVTTSGAVLVGLSIVAMALFEREIIDRAGAANRELAFIRSSKFVSNMIDKTGGIHNLVLLQALVQEVRELRPGITRLSVFEITPESSALLLSTDPQAVPHSLDSQERTEIEAGRPVMELDTTSGERAWRITAPITIEGKVVGALRGLFSTSEYDELIKRQMDLAKTIGIGVVIVTSLTFLLLIRMKIHHPVHRLLDVMRRVETGDLSSHASIRGPSELQEVAAQFNRMLDRIREAGIEKDRLLEEVRHFNETLQKRIADATTELQQRNVELVEARLSIERSQRLAVLGELSATVAHELGNPLNALSGHLQMLTHADDPANRQRHLAVIRSEVDRMVRIIQELLNQTHVPFSSAPVDLNTTIHEVLALLSPGLSRQHVTFKTDLQGDLPPVSGDSRALHGLLFNLVTNAKQAMPYGGELIIQTLAVCGAELPGAVMVDKSAETDDTVVRLTIADTGKGIPPEHISRIFEPFFTTRQAEGGTGLGLAICHRVVTDSGGRLAVKSEVGRGTEFTVDLPIWSAVQEIRR